MYRYVFLILAILPGVFSVPVTGEAPLPKECQQKDCPDGTTYHCLADELWDVVNICMKRRMMPSGMCPYYNSYQGNLDARRCERAMKPGDCPTENFYSQDGSKYPNCMVMSEYVMSLATVKVTTRDFTTDMTSTSRDFELEKSIMTAEAGMQEALHTSHDSKTNGGVVAIVVIMVILLIIALSFAVWIVVMKRRDRNFSFQQWFRRRTEICRCSRDDGQDDGHRNLDQHRTENSEDSPFLQNTPGEVPCAIPNLHANVVVNNGDINHVESQINDEGDHDTLELDVRSEEINPDANAESKNIDLAFHAYSVHSNPEGSYQKHTVSSETSHTTRSPSDNCGLHENARNESERKELEEISITDSTVNAVFPDSEQGKDLSTSGENALSTGREIAVIDSKVNTENKSRDIDVYKVDSEFSKLLEGFSEQDNSKNNKDNETATESTNNEDKGGDQSDSEGKEECTANVEYRETGLPVQPLYK